MKESKRYLDWRRKFKLPKPWIVKKIKPDTKGYQCIGSTVEISHETIDLKITISGNYISYSKPPRVELDIDGYILGRYMGAMGCNSWMYSDIKECTPEFLISKLEEGIEHVKEIKSRPLVMINGHGWRLTPERIKEVSDLLNKGEVASFSTSGFGTWQYLSTAPQGRYAYDKYLDDPKLFKLFKVKSLYLREEEMD